MTKTVRIKIRGVGQGLLMNRFPLEPVAGFAKMTKEEQAEIAAYRLPDSKELYIPGVAIQQSLINAAVFSKGKGRASLQKPAAACFLIDPEYIGLGQVGFDTYAPICDYSIDSRAVVNPSTKGRIVRHRPRLAEWEAEFELEYDPVLLSAEQARTIVDDAGKRVGVLDYRPACKGPFGKFVVTAWEELKE